MVSASREIALPFRFDADGGVAFTDNDTLLVEQRLKTVIMTRVGERLMLPQYGSPTMDYLFEVNDQLAMTELAGFVDRAVRTWEPSIVLRKVAARMDADNGTMEISVSYSVSPHEDVHSTIVSVGGSIQDVTT